MVVRSLSSTLTRIRATVVAGVVSLLATSAAASPPALVDASGRRVSIALASGERGLVVHFWATWCASCAQELPTVASAAAQCAAQRVRVHIAAAGESAEVVRAYQTRHALAFDALLDPRGRAWRAAGGFGLPANWLRSAEGDRLLPGPRSALEWTELLRSLGCVFDPARRAPDRTPR